MRRMPGPPACRWVGSRGDAFRHAGGWYRTRDDACSGELGWDFPCMRGMERVDGFAPSLSEWNAVLFEPTCTCSLCFPRAALYILLPWGR